MSKIRINLLVWVFVSCIAGTVSAQNGQRCEEQLPGLATKLAELPDSILRAAAVSTNVLLGDAGDTTYYNWVDVSVVRITQRTEQNSSPGMDRLINTQIHVKTVQFGSDLAISWSWDQVSRSWKWDNSNTAYIPIQKDMCIIATNLQMAWQFIMYIQQEPTEALPSLGEVLAELSDPTLERFATLDRNRSYVEMGGAHMLLAQSVVIAKSDEAKRVVVQTAESYFFSYDYDTHSCGWYVMKDKVLEVFLFSSDAEKRLNDSYAVRALASIYWQILLTE